MTPALIIAILEALPALMQTLPRVVALVERFLNWSGSNDVNKWIDSLEAGIDQLEKAETPEQKLAAARALVDSIRHVK